MQTDAPHNTTRRERQRNEAGHQGLPLSSDPRESEDWFLRLPPSIQEEFRSDWRHRSEKYQRYVDENRRRRPRTLMQGMTMVTIPVALGAMCQGLFSPITLSVPFGLLAGFGWSRFGAGRLWSSLSGMAAAFSAMALGGGSSGILGASLTIACTTLAGFLCAHSGLRREIDWRELAP